LDVDGVTNGTITVDVKVMVLSDPERTMSQVEAVALGRRVGARLSVPAAPAEAERDAAEAPREDVRVTEGNMSEYRSVAIGGVCVSSV
jgi:hypothetical protein